jgi:hypothetical protein
MMFSVHWKGDALDDLTSIWLKSDSNARKAITAATNLIEEELQNSPENKGESREGSERVLFVFPLGIKYKVYVAQNVVAILHVWAYRRHK